MPGPEVKIVRMSDIGRCTKTSLSPAHYYADGTCRCSEREAAKAFVKAAEEKADQALAELAEARRWKRST